MNLNKITESEKKYYLEYGQNDYDGIDVRGIWEENRFQDLINISLNGKKTYSQNIVDNINDYIKNWVKENPYGYGLNWVSPMETAIRAANLLMTLELMGVKGEYSKEINNFIEYSLKHIFQNIEVTLKAPLNNHYLSNIAGIIYILLIYKNVKNREKLIRFYLRELEYEINNQVFDDGVNFENSCGYHKFVTEIFLYTGLLCEKYSFLLSNSYWTRVKKMLRYIADIKMPDGKSANFGDTDNGHWHRFGYLDNEGSYENDCLLSLGCLKTGIPYLEKYNSMDNKCFELLCEYYNIDSPKVLKDELPLTTNVKKYNKGGVYVIKEDKFKIIINTKNSSKHLMSLHKHNDVLSFELAYKNYNVVVDSGTYCYTKNKEIHNMYRSTKFHNTLMIDGMEQEDLSIAGNFALPNINLFKVINFETDKTQTSFSGKLEYINELHGISHQRTILYRKIDNVISINDKVEGTSNHKLDWYYHLHPSIQVTNECNLTLINSIEEQIVKFEFPAGLELSIEDYYYAEKYGSQIPSKCLHFSTCSNLPFEASFKLKLL